MPTVNPPTSLAQAEALDRIDRLRARREAFALPEGVFYLDGHSLGPATHAALERLARTAGEEWARGLIRSWNAAGWIDLPARVGARIARLIGAQSSEALVCDSVTVNLFKLAAAALPLARARVIVVEEGEFPTDQYVADGLGGALGARVERAAPEGGLAALAGGGVLIKSVTHYRTAACADVAAHEAAARDGGGLIVWDLSHAVGAIALRLNADGALLGAGCTYKHLNGGPGAPAFVYVARAIADKLASPIPGWFGHAAPFAFDDRYRPAAGVARFAAGTPPILSLAALDAALDAFDGVDMADVEAKAQALGALAIARAEAMGIAVASPRGPLRRGAHVTVLRDDGFSLVQAGIAQGVIGDFREPDAVRFGVSPLYLGFADIWRAMDKVERILRAGAHLAPAFAVRGKVT